MESLQASISEMKAMFSAQLADFQKSLDQATPSTTVSALAADYALFKKFIVTSLTSLQRQADCLALECDRLEMRSRKKILLVHGVPESSSEETGSLLAKLALDRMKVKLLPDAVTRSHRMGRTVGNKPRPILVKFSRMSDRDNFWYAKTVLKGSGITISEFLTKSRHDVFMEARRRVGISKCWTRYGVIVVTAAGGAQHRLVAMEELDKVAPLAQTAPAPSSGASGSAGGGQDASNARAKRTKKQP